MGNDIFTQTDTVQDNWEARCAEVLSIQKYLENHYGDYEASERLIPFIEDEKWEVRKEVAAAMASVNDGSLSRFIPLLTDGNIFVVENARRSMEQRNIYVKSKEKQERDESKIFRNLEKIRKKFGPEAARLAREGIEDAYQLTVGYAVHDIRGMATPIAGDLNQIYDIVQNELNSMELIQVNQRRQAILRRVEMIIRMADDMKELAKKTPKAKMSENLHELLAAAVRDTQEIFAGKNRDISLVSFNMEKVPKDIVIPVVRVPIIRVFTNLLKNAVESYMMKPDKAKRGNVDIYAVRTITGVEIIIRDYGMGMNENDLKHYRMFLPRSSSKKTTGSGLGLAIAYAKIKDHGGTLELSSEGEGKGLTATIYLPGGKNDCAI